MGDDFFPPTWLYIKQHYVTGMLYFGKTTKDVLTYNGSGVKWCEHYKKNGGPSYIVTLWCELFFDRKSILKFATEFSKSMNIVHSPSWANLIPEDGLGENYNSSKRKPKRTKRKFKTKAERQQAKDERNRIKRQVRREYVYKIYSFDSVNR